MSVSHFSFLSQGEKGSEGEIGKKVSHAVKMSLLTGGSQTPGEPVAMTECAGVIRTHGLSVSIHFSAPRKYSHFFLCGIFLFSENSSRMSSLFA